MWRFGITFLVNEDSKEANIMDLQRNDYVDKTLVSDAKKKGKQHRKRKPIRKRFTKKKRRRHQRKKQPCQQDLSQNDLQVGMIKQEHTVSHSSSLDENELNISGLQALPPDDDEENISQMGKKVLPPGSLMDDAFIQDTDQLEREDLKCTEANTGCDFEMDTSALPLTSWVDVTEAPQKTKLSGNEGSQSAEVMAVIDSQMIPEHADFSAVVEISLGANYVMISKESPGVGGTAETTTSSTPLLAPIRSIGQVNVAPSVRVLLERVYLKLMVMVPSLWLPIIKDNGTQVGLFAENALFVVQRSLFILPDGSVSCTVHNRDLSTDHPFWNNVPKVPLCSDGVEEFAKNVSRMVHALASLEMCPGVEQFEHLWERAQNCKVDCNLFHEKNYNTTCRSDFCSLLFVKGKKTRCFSCQNVFRTFSKREARSKKDTDSPAQRTANSYFNTPQQRKCLAKKNAQLRMERQRNIRLTEKINALLTKEGIETDDKTTDDVTAILQSAKTSGLSELQLRFIQEQIAAPKTKPCGMKRHPAVIRLVPRKK